MKEVIKGVIAFSVATIATWLGLAALVMGSLYLHLECGIKDPMVATLIAIVVMGVYGFIAAEFVGWIMRL